MRKSFVMNFSNFFNKETIKRGSERIISCIDKNYQTLSQKIVQPKVEPGFLRMELPEMISNKGKQIQTVIENIEKKILPGSSFYHSPKYFGHFSLSISDTSVLAQMFSTAFHSPAYLYIHAPAFTELENIMVDWCAKMTGIPQKFQFKNTGGGIISPTATQALFTVVHAAKMRKVKQLGIELCNPKILKFVGYYTDFCHRSAEKALTLKDIHYKRIIPSVYNNKSKNFQICPTKFKQMIQNDIKYGFIPFWFGGTYGSTLTCAIDLNAQVINLAKDYGMWLSIDAVYMGSSWIIQKNQPPKGFLQKADSIIINFSKNLLVGNGGSLLFVGDRTEFSNSICKQSDVSYYKNNYSQTYETITDYMNWTVGLDRRLNVFKFYFLFEHYGLQKLQGLVRQIQERGQLFEKWVNQSDIFQLFSHRYGLVTFRVKDPLTNKPCNELTAKVIDATRNTQNGYCTPGEFQEYRFLRFNFGNYGITTEIMKQKFNQVEKIASKTREEIILRQSLTEENEKCYLF